MDKRQEYLQKIDAIPTVSFNKELKEIAKKIIAQTADADLSAVFGLITQRVKTGFVFDEAPEVNHNAMALAVEKPDLNIGVSGLETMEGKTEHTLIIGENYDALKNLCATYIDKNGRGLIDVIYIDPPYNTEKSSEDGNDYKEQVEAAKFIYRDKFTRDGWLNMMNERLKLARRLLSDKGVLFISIDDSEQAYLKVLCDEIFGEENFVACLIWKSKSGGANDSRYFAIDQEYVLCYSKQIQKLKINKDTDATVSTSYNKTDEKGKYALDRLDKQSIRYSSSLDYEIIGPDGLSYFPKHKDPKNPNATWRWSKEHVELNYNELVFENGCVYTKNYEKDGVIPRSLLIDKRFGRTRTGKTLLYSIFKTNIFSNPKPIGLIKHLIKLISNPTSTILDFFAGSGTTGQAVMELNEDDHGNRKFILVTNNENGIGEKITRERLYRVINGKGSGGEEIAWKYSAEKPCLQNNCVRVFGIETHELTLQDLDKAEKLKEQAKTEFKKLNSAYDNTNDFDIYNELAALNPIK